MRYRIAVHLPHTHSLTGHTLSHTHMYTPYIQSQALLLVYGGFLICLTLVFRGILTVGSACLPFSDFNPSTGLNGSWLTSVTHSHPHANTHADWFHSIPPKKFRFPALSRGASVVADTVSHVSQDDDFKG